MIRILFCALLVLLSATTTSGQATFFGPTAYESTADIPAGFYAIGPTALEDFEDGVLGFGITVSGGELSSSYEATLVDSVDADDGVLDHDGSDGESWFELTMGSGTLEFTFSPPLPTAAALVWTDGTQGATTTFEAFGPGMISLGPPVQENLGDAFNTGETEEDRFFGVQSPGGILALRIQTSGVDTGIEVDHVQFGSAGFQAVPSISPLLLGCLATCVVLIAVFMIRRGARIP